MRISEINTDADISVATCDLDGNVQIWDSMNDNGARPFLRALSFKHYGAARLYATEYDENQRAARKMRPR